MSKKGEFSVGLFILKLALGLYFIVSGIIALQGGAGDGCIVAIQYLVSGTLATILCSVMGVIELLAGVVLLLSIFSIFEKKLNDVLMIIIMIVWIIAIVLIDLLGNDGLLNGFGGNFMQFVARFSQHLLILGSIILLK